MRTQSSWSCATERRTNSWGSCAQAAATVISTSRVSALIPDDSVTRLAETSRSSATTYGFNSGWPVAWALPGLRLTRRAFLTLTIDQWTVALVWLAEGQHIEFAIPDLANCCFQHFCGKQTRGSDDGSRAVFEERSGDNLVL